MRICLCITSEGRFVFVGWSGSKDEFPNTEPIVRIGFNLGPFVSGLILDLSFIRVDLGLSQVNQVRVILVLLNMAHHRIK